MFLLVKAAGRQAASAQPHRAPTGSAPRSTYNLKVVVVKQARIRGDVGRGATALKLLVGWLSLLGARLLKQALLAARLLLNSKAAPQPRTYSYS